MAEPHLVVPPWWERLLHRLVPDNKGWLSVFGGIVILYLLEMIRENPQLLANASFMQFAGTLSAGSFLVLYAHFFGGTKTGSDVMTAQSKQITAQAGAAPKAVEVVNPAERPVQTQEAPASPPGPPVDPFKIRD